MTNFWKKHLKHLRKEYDIKKVIDYRKKGYSFSKIFNLCIEFDEEKREKKNLPKLDDDGDYEKELKEQIVKDWTQKMVDDNDCFDLHTLQECLNSKLPNFIYYLDYDTRAKIGIKAYEDYHLIHKENQSLKQENRNLRLMSKNNNVSSLSRQLVGLIQWYKETTACNVPRLEYLELVGKYGKIEPDEWDTDDEDIKNTNIM